MNNQPQSWLSANIKSLLSVMTVTFVFTYFFYCAVCKVQPDQQVLIAVVTASGTVLGYWFGSSSGSSKKDDILGNATGNPTITGDKPTVTVNTPPAETTQQ